MNFYEIERARTEIPLCERIRGVTHGYFPTAPATVYILHSPAQAASWGHS